MKSNKPAKIFIILKIVNLVNLKKKWHRILIKTIENKSQGYWGWKTSPHANLKGKSSGSHSWFPFQKNKTSRWQLFFFLNWADDTSLSRQMTCCSLLPSPIIENQELGFVLF